MKEIALERIKSPKVKCNSIISFSFDDKKKIIFFFMYVKFWFSQLLEKNCKRKELESYANIFFMVGKMDVHFSKGRPKNFILFLSDIL